MATGKQQVVYLLNNSITLGTLAAQTTINAATQIDNARLQGMRIKKMKGAFRLINLTQNDGPILYGFTTGLSTAEVTEALLADPQSVDDVPAVERGNRKVFPIGILSNGAETTPVLEQPLMWRRIRFPWPEIPESQDLAFFAFNLDTSALTTGATLRFDGVVVGDWLDD